VEHASAMAKILIVEDEADILRGLEINLKREGYDVAKATRGDAAVNAVLHESPDLVLLDVMLPGMSGVDVCRELRRRGIETPIVFLTARADEVDRVVGLEIGADDYVTKPFSPRELMARIRLRLRRQPARADSGPHRYRFGDVELDFDAFTATRDGKPIELRTKEFEIMRLLIRCRGEVVTRDRMLNEVWGYETSPTTRTVDTHILRLRQKLEADPPNPRHILSMYGEGYRFVD
jgi:two-component system alkaline phosphatase synthesis response regulator PhoP